MLVKWVTTSSMKKARVVTAEKQQMTNIFLFFIFCSKEQHSLTTTSIPGVNKVVSWHSFIVSCIQFVGENLNRRGQSLVGFVLCLVLELVRPLS